MSNLSGFSPKVTITRPSRSDGKRTIVIEISDDTSGLLVCRVTMDARDFAECVTGLGLVPAVLDHWVGDNADKVGKKRICKTIHIRRPHSYDDAERRMEVRRNSKVLAECAKGWVLWCDGVGRQQPGDTWSVQLVRYA